MKVLKLLALVVVVMLVLVVPAMAQEAPAGHTTYVLSGAGIGTGIAVAVTILGAGLGFGRIGGSALESMARQPEVAGRIQTAMLIIAALLEGATFFALIVALLLGQTIGTGRGF
jgi:F-type H+-transporting ATPase subunit c